MAQDNPNQPDQLLATGEVARLLGCSQRTVQKRVKEGRLRAMRVRQTKGSPYRFRPCDVAAYERACLLPDAKLRYYVIWEPLQERPHIRLKRADCPLPRPATALAEHLKHRVYVDADGALYGCITNTTPPAPQAKPWYYSSPLPPGDIPPGETQWFRILFRED